jgi:alpha-glucosidase
MRPVFYDYPDALSSGCDQALSFTLGRNLLVSGPPRPESPEAFDICLPAGGWYDYWTGLPVTKTKVTETPRLDYLPVFVRAGTILPRQPLVQSTAQKPQGPLSLDIYPGPDCRGDLYLDDGLTVNGAKLRQTIRCSVTAKGLSLQFGSRRGSYKPWWKSIAVTVHGWKGDAAVRGGSPASYDPSAQTLRFSIPDQPGPTEFSVDRP